MFVFQSVSFSSNLHCSLPPFEIVVHGCLVPGMEATRHPCGNGTWQGRPVSPFSIVKLQANSVVAPESSSSCAVVSEEGMRRSTSCNTKRRNPIHRIDIGVDGSTLLYLAAMIRAA